MKKIVSVVAFLVLAAGVVIVVQLIVKPYAIYVSMVSTLVLLVPCFLLNEVYPKFIMGVLGLSSLLLTGITIAGNYWNLAYPYRQELHLLGTLANLGFFALLFGIPIVRNWKTLEQTVWKLMPIWILILIEAFVFGYGFWMISLAVYWALILGPVQVKLLRKQENGGKRKEGQFCQRGFY